MSSTSPARPSTMLHRRHRDGVDVVAGDGGVAAGAFGPGVAEPVGGPGAPVAGTGRPWCRWIGDGSRAGRHIGVAGPAAFGGSPTPAPSVKEAQQQRASVRGGCRMTSRSTRAARSSRKPSAGRRLRRAGERGQGVRETHRGPRGGYRGRRPRAERARIRRQRWSASPASIGQRCS